MTPKEPTHDSLALTTCTRSSRRPVPPPRAEQKPERDHNGESHNQHAVVECLGDSAGKRPPPISWRDVTRCSAEHADHGDDGSGEGRHRAERQRHIGCPGSVARSSGATSKPACPEEERHEGPGRCHEDNYNKQSGEKPHGVIVSQVSVT